MMRKLLHASGRVETNEPEYPAMFADQYGLNPAAMEYSQTQGLTLLRQHPESLGEFLASSHLMRIA